MSLRSSSALKIFVPHLTLPRPCRWEDVFARRGPLTVEIGFGLGEALARNAAACPQMNFIGFETDWQRLCKTLERFERAGLGNAGNVRIIRLEAKAAMERLFKQRSIDGIYCLFPCPWPKKKHAKHRLFSRASLKLMNSRLKDHSCLKIVTDYFPYVEWIKEQAQDSGFTFVSNDITARFGTKFENKWRREGQETFFEIQLQKIKHINSVFKKDVPMKNYRLPAFDPAKFDFKERKEGVTVVGRHTYFDAQQNVCLVHVLVAEENLTQDFWASIAKRDKGWVIKHCEGHPFFPTPGTAKALEWIYEAAKESTA
jgi:tRNA (guanine-N7-)-methyltransferase